MTTRQKRKDIRGSSVITGLHLERDVAQRLCDQAREDAAGNVAELARYYIRIGLGATAAQANRLGEGNLALSSGLAGLGLDAWTRDRLIQEVARQGIAKAAIARHLIRRGLGFSEKESKRREAGFAALANARHGLHDVFRGASEE